jgi:predicted ester cyclase
VRSDEMKRLVRRHYEEVLTGRNLEVVDEIYAAQIRNGDGGTIPREQFKEIARMSLTAFPDLVVTVKDQIVEGDRVVSRWTATGTQDGQFMQLPPTGRKVTIRAIHIHQIVEGRIAVLWEEIDMLGLFQ